MKKSTTRSLKLKKLSLLKEKQRRRVKNDCEQSYYEFFKHGFEILHPHEIYEDNWHIKYLCDILQLEIVRIANRDLKTKDLIINIPPRSLKSSITTVLLNAWAWIHYPHLKFVTASYSGDLAIEHAVETRKLIETQWYQSNWSYCFQLSSDQNVKSKFVNTEGGFRRATSVGGTVTGQGGDVVICDDPHKVNEIDSVVAREKVIKWWTQTMHSRLNDQKIGLRMVIMQRLHEKDLTGYLLNNDSYKKIIVPAEKSDQLQPKELSQYYNDNLFFSKRFSKNILIQTKDQLGSLGYAGQYQQTPSPEKGNIIKGHWFKRFKLGDISNDITRKFYSDTAYGKENSDNSATICYSCCEGNFYIWNVWCDISPFPRFIDNYKEFLIQNNYTNSSICYFEPKSSGTSIVQQLKEEKIDIIGYINVMEDKSPSDNKVTRVKAASPKIESGRVYLLQNQAWIEGFVDECNKFPSGEYDDRVDSLAGLINLETREKEIAFAIG